MLKAKLGRAITRGYQERSSGSLEAHGELRNVDDVKRLLGITHLEDLYKVKKAEVTGPALDLITHFGGVLKLARAIFPEHKWQEWRFENYVSVGYWDVRQNRRDFFEWAAAELHLSIPEGLYKLQKLQVNQLYGGGMLVTYYHDSVGSAVIDLFPEYQFDGWRFSSQPHHFWDDKTNMKNFLTHIEREYSITQLEGWYSISFQMVDKIARSSSSIIFSIHYKGLIKRVYEPERPISERYSNLMADLVEVLHPKSGLKNWLFKDAGSSVWEHRSTCFSLCWAIGKAKNLQPIHGWYKITEQDIAEQNALSVFTVHRSVYELLRFMEDEVEWLAWRFADAAPSKDFWANLRNQQHFATWFAKDSGFDGDMSKWYSVTTAQVSDKGGAGLIAQYDGSLSAALSKIFPDHHWQGFLFDRVSSGYWNDPANHKLYFEWIGQQLGVKQLEDWYKVSKQQLIEMGAGGLVANYYSNSPSKAITAQYPEHTWHMWLFDTAPMGYMDNVQAQQMYFDWLKTKLGITSMDGWYKVTKADVISNSGASVLSRHRNSVSSALVAVYPEHHWQRWKFDKAPQGFWKSQAQSSDVAAAMEFLEDAAKQLKLSSLEDWYRVSKVQLNSISGAAGLLEAYGGLASALQRVYPGHSWSNTKFKASTKKSAQKELCDAVRKMFPDQEIREEYKLTSTWVGSKRLDILFDIFVPALRIALEFDGEHHYGDVSGVGQWTEKAASDAQKMAICLREGISLVRVPYWWDRKQSTLKQLVVAVRPELVASS